MIDRARVSACLVTRGNVPMDHILDTLSGFDEIIVYDNKRELDLKVAGRLEAIRRARNPVVYTQDDDVIFRHQKLLLDQYEPGVLVANDGHGANPGGYDDLAFTCAGGVLDRDLFLDAADRYLAVWPNDSEWRYECDFVTGMLTPFRHVVLPYERLYVDDNTRMCRQPWQETLKAKITARARELRGGPSLEQPGSVTIARGGAPLQ